MKDFCIIGSGISGATIAKALSKKFSLDVHDKARGAGGRSSNKKLNKNESFDHGVQYISPKSIQFKSFIKSAVEGRVLGPVNAPIFRLKRKFRVRFLIRGRKSLIVQNSLAKTIEKFKFPTGMKLTVDVDPINFN